MKKQQAYFLFSAVAIVQVGYAVVKAEEQNLGWLQLVINPGAPLVVASQAIRFSLKANSTGLKTLFFLGLGLILVPFLLPFVVLGGGGSLDLYNGIPGLIWVYLSWKIKYGSK